MKYYVNYYELYPIYEPAEGGYYYSGREASVLNCVNSRKKAMRIFKKIAKEFKQESPEVKSYILSHATKYDNYLAKVYFDGRYIGEGFGYVLTRGEPLKNKGYEPYC